MRRSPNRAALTDEVARFQAEVRSLALDVIRAVVKQELDRRQPASPPARRRAAPAVRAAAARSEPAAAPAPVRPPPPQPAEPATGKGKRVRWTREAVIEELATWMLSGTAIDATFVTRHGPPGLVAATRRIFGRFEAALNVAGLHVSKLYPDGPPNRT